MSTYICEECSDEENGKYKFRVWMTDTTMSAFADCCPSCGSEDIEYL